MTAVRSAGLRARTSIAVERGGVLRELRCEAPLTVRRVYGEPGECALCHVGTAAGPLPGDDLMLLLDIGPDANARLLSAGASIAQRADRTSADRTGAARPARMRSQVTVGLGARLVAEPPPLIVAAGADVEATVSIALMPGACVRWRELIVLGRAGEPGGSLLLRWHATCDGLPLLRQTIDLRDSALAGWPAMLHDRTVLASALIAGPEVSARTIIASPTAVAQPLAEDAVLISVLGDDAAAVEAQLAWLCAQL